MSESEEWAAYYFEHRHAHRIRKLENALFLPTILVHIGNILFLRDTKWVLKENINVNTPHSPRSSFTPLSTTVTIEYIDPVAILYVMYLLAGSLSLIFFSVTKLFSPTLNKDISTEAISITRCRNKAGATSCMLLIVLPALYKLHPIATLFLVLFLYKFYVVMTLTNYVKILKVHGNYRTNSQNTYPIDRPVSISMVDDNVNCQMTTSNPHPSVTNVQESDCESSRYSSLIANYSEPSAPKIHRDFADLPPSYEEATKQMNTK